jgi:hypothetical protein
MAVVAVVNSVILAAEPENVIDESEGADVSDIVDESVDAVFV